MEGWRSFFQLVDSKNQLTVGFDEINELTQQLAAAQRGASTPLSQTQLCLHFLPSATTELVHCLGRLIQLTKPAETTQVGRKRGRKRGIQEWEQAFWGQQTHTSVLANHTLSKVATEGEIYSRNIKSVSISYQKGSANITLKSPIRNFSI